MFSTAKPNQSYFSSFWWGEHQIWPLVSSRAHFCLLRSAACFHGIKQTPRAQDCTWEGGDKGDPYFYQTLMFLFFMGGQFWRIMLPCHSNKVPALSAPLPVVSFPERRKKRNSSVLALSTILCFILHPLQPCGDISVTKRSAVLLVLMTASC